MSRITRILSLALLVVLALSLITSTACRRKAPPTPPSIDLTATMVPNVDLDAYIYFKQEGPTKIPGNLIGTPADASVESVALWAIADSEQYGVGGSLTMASASEASTIAGKIPVSMVWTALADRTLYFVAGSSPAALKMKDAISRNDFKKYDNAGVLETASHLPGGGNTKLAGIAVVKPTRQLVKLISTFGDRNTGDMLNTLLDSAKLQPIVAGFYAPGQIDLSDMVQRALRGNIWEAEMGIVLLVKSDLPGVVVAPLAGQYLEKTGYTTVNIGGVNMYKGSLSAQGRSVPLFVVIDGNRLALAVSAKENYAQSLITGVKK